jgi:hypothetical protein
MERSLRWNKVIGLCPALQGVGLYIPRRLRQMLLERSED